MTIEKDKKKFLRPTQCNMPDLSSLNDKNVLGIVVSFFIGDSPTKYLPKALVINFVRTIDQIVREYENARVALLEFIKNQPSTYVSPYFHAVGYFENLLIHLKRAVLFIRKIKKNKELTSVIGKVKLNEPIAELIVNIRNAVEHLDSDLVKGKIPENEPWFLILQNDSLVFKRKKILYKELANFIMSLYFIAQNLVRANYGSQS